MHEMRARRDATCERGAATTSARMPMVNRISVDAVSRRAVTRIQVIENISKYHGHLV